MGDAPRMSIDDTRRAALKALVPLAHQTAAEYSRYPGNQGWLAIAEEIRAFADKMDEVATSGTSVVVAAFFGALH